ncbi:MAG: hypothetical protein ABI772_00420 [Bacteroidota bacterium]
MKKNTSFYFLLVSILIFIVRLPFIFLGYGSEEDAWGLPLTAERIASTGVYEVSRLPGHPLQEVIYAFVFRFGFIYMNLLTMAISAAGIFFFMQILRFFKVHYPVWPAIALAFTPVVFINSTNVMDYIWAMSGIITSFYFLCRKEYLLAGLFLGLAIGCRITSGAVLLPFVIYVFITERDAVFKKIITCSLVTMITGLLCFLPVIKEYGLTFFTYYEHFPLPPVFKNIYKGTIGVFGLVGCISLGVYLIVIFRKLMHSFKSFDACNKGLVIMCISAAVLYIIAFINLPLKSAFMIPAIPFIFLLMAKFLTERQSVILACLFIISSFCFGINLKDSNRGNIPSAVSCSFKIASQEVTFDLLKGPVIAEYEKQKNILEFTDNVLTRASTIKHRSVVIAGWYLNFIQKKGRHLNNDIVKCVYYIDADSVSGYKVNGYDVYYLPLQEQFNDLRFGINNTAELSSPFPG